MKKFLGIVCTAFLLTAGTALAQGYKVGDIAQDFALKSVSGQQVSLKTHAGTEGAIVIFTCNHCPYSVLYEDRIITLHTLFAKKGYPVIAINPNDSIVQPKDSYSEMQVRAREKNFPFQYILDGTQEIAKTYGATRTPHVFLLQRTGENFTVRYIGAIDDNSESAEEAKEHYVQQAIAQLLANKQPEKSFTKAIGCTIKWKK